MSNDFQSAGFVFTRLKYSCASNTETHWECFSWGDAFFIRNLNEMVKIRVPEPSYGEERETFAFARTASAADVESLLVYPFLFMHSYCDFSLPPLELSNIKIFIDNGGFLWADEAAFDKLLIEDYQKRAARESEMEKTRAAMEAQKEKSEADAMLNENSESNSSPQEENPEEMIITYETASDIPAEEETDDTPSEQISSDGVVSNRGGIFTEVPDHMLGSELDSFFRSVLNMIKNLYPEAELHKIPLSHPLFRCYFQIPENPFFRGRTPEIYGIYIRSRLAVIITPGDIQGAWCQPDNSWYGRDSYKIGLATGVNIVMWALTQKKQRAPLLRISSP